MSDIVPNVECGIGTIGQWAHLNLYRNINYIRIRVLFCVARQIATIQNKTANSGLGWADCDRLMRSYRVKQICVKLMLDNVGASQSVSIRPRPRSRFF
jgi:hypothetical protein